MIFGGVLKTLKRLANKRMELSVLSIREYDEDYSKAMNRVQKLEEQYELMRLEEKERKVVEELLSAMDDVEIEQSNISYLAGFLDGIMILGVLDLLRE